MQRLSLSKKSENVVLETIKRLRGSVSSGYYFCVSLCEVNCCYGNFFTTAYKGKGSIHTGVIVLHVCFIESCHGA